MQWAPGNGCCCSDVGSGHPPLERGQSGQAAGADLQERHLWVELPYELPDMIKAVCHLAATPLVDFMPERSPLPRKVQERIRAKLSHSPLLFFALSFVWIWNAEFSPTFASSPSSFPRTQKVEFSSRCLLKCRDSRDTVSYNCEDTISWCGNTTSYWRDIHCVSLFGRYCLYSTILGDTSRRIQPRVLWVARGSWSHQEELESFHFLSLYWWRDTFAWAQIPSERSSFYKR